MKFIAPLIEGRLIRRYKRFLADIELNDGQIITAHTANTGAMTGCAEPGSRVWLSESTNLKRKYRHTWELVQAVPPAKSLIGINTQRSNALVKEAIAAGVVPELKQYTNIRAEVRYGQENSRIDLLLESHNTTGIENCYVEVKNVTLFATESNQRIGYFPDAVTARGERHLRELQHMVAMGQRAIIFYCVQCCEVDEVRPAAHIDQAYANTLKAAVEAGVQALAYRAEVSPEAITLTDRVPVVIS